MAPIKAVRGVRDILPTETGRWQRVEAAARRTFEAYGYAEIRVPLFERTELFARGIGDETDIVTKEMYTFDDRSGESLTLRPEATASLMRAYIEHGLHVRPKPVKIYTMGPMFRYERPQAGRYRQFHQLDVEALGEPHPALDAEVIAMLLDFFGALGLRERLELHINSIGDPGTRPAYVALLVAYLEPHAARLCAQCRERLARNPLRVLDCKVPDCQPVIDKAPSTVNPRLVRGLDYYVRTTFELKTKDLGAQDAVAGGGRYDGLIKELGGPPDPGIGFAVGMERVVLLLAHGDQPAGEQRGSQVSLIPLGEAALRRLLPVARAARQAGVPVELGYGARKLQKELERANRLGASWAVIVGDDELAKDEAVLREMRSGEQRRVSLARLAEELSALGGPGRNRGGTP